MIELEVKKEESINIRFIQFYKEYFEENEALFYEYSPLCMELYNERKNLIEDCQGIPEVLEGVRSSRKVFLTQIFAKIYSSMSSLASTICACKLIGSMKQHLTLATWLCIRVLIMWLSKDQRRIVHCLLYRCGTQP